MNHEHYEELIGFINELRAHIRKLESELHTEVSALQDEMTQTRQEVQGSQGLSPREEIALRYTLQSKAMPIAPVIKKALEQADLFFEISRQDNAPDTIGYSYSSIRFLVQELDEEEEWTEILDTQSLDAAKECAGEDPARRILTLTATATTASLL